MEFENLNVAKECADEARKQWLIASAADISDADRVFARELGNASWDEYEKYHNLHCAQAYFCDNNELHDRESTSLFRDLMIDAQRRSDMHPLQRFARDTVDFFDTRLAPLVRSSALVGGLLFLGWLAGCWTVTVGQSCASL